jgi:SAM-dependent methyltransferase
VLDLASGGGAATKDLVRRSGGRVVAVDRDPLALASSPQNFSRANRICADAERLPFASETFDLVFSQFAMLWLNVSAAVGEIRRVLRADGVLVALEPDYGGMIDYPPGISAREIWISALRRSGADPEIGRKLPGLLHTAEFDVRVDLLDRLEPPSPTRFQFLHGLSLTEDEKQALRHIAAADTQTSGPGRVVHLPIFLITATKEPPRGADSAV